MRFKIDSAKAHIIGYTLLTWVLTACAADRMPTAVNYDVVQNFGHLEKGKMTTRIADANGRVVFDSTYTASELRTSRLAGLPHLATSLDSLNMQALGAYLVGRNTRAGHYAPLTLSLGGHQFQIRATQRGAKGEATAFTIKVGESDTTIVVNAPNAGTGERRVEMKAGNKVIYNSAAAAGRASLANQIEGVPIGGGGEDESWCSDRFALAVGELSVGLAAVLDGIAQINIIELILGLVIFITGLGELLIWILDDCYQSFNDWLLGFWLDACGNPFLSWTPFCE